MTKVGRIAAIAVLATLLAIVLLATGLMIASKSVHAKNPNLLPNYQSWSSEIEMTNAVPDRVIVIRKYFGPPDNPMTIRDVNDLIATYAFGTKKPSFLVWIRTATNGQKAYVRSYRTEENAWVLVSGELFTRKNLQPNVSEKVFLPDSESGKLMSLLFCGENAQSCEVPVPTVTFEK